MRERTENRHSHISIGLRVKVADTWQPLRALGWNPQGFNCYTEFEMHAPTLQLRRATADFEGTLLWSANNSDEDVLSAAVVNEMLFKQAQNLAHDNALRARLFKLLRAPWLTAEKRRVLASLGTHLTDSELKALVAQRHLMRPLYHCGVKVDSDIWRSAVQEALQVSSVVLSLEKLTEGFGTAP